MVVDDSVVVRGLVARWLDEDPDLVVVASHRNGRLALEDLNRAAPDVIILDIEMPEMDGLTALPLMRAKRPQAIVVMASTLTRRNAEASLKAIALGATDYVSKPESGGRISTSLDFRTELVDKVRALGLRAKGRVATPRPLPAPATSPAACEDGAPVPRRLAARPEGAPQLRAFSRVRPAVLLVGSSTGGPQALGRLFSDIKSAIGNVPVLVTQHMPPTFTAILAEHIGKNTGRKAAEAVHGERLVAGHVYVAPGGRHMLVSEGVDGPAIRLSDDPPVNYCRPAVDPLFESGAAAFGGGTLAVVLTGMGSDGAVGTMAVAKAGGSVIAQDEATSVVWGMPGAALATGCCAAMLPLGEIGPAVARILSGGRT